MASIWICIASSLLVFPLRSFFLIGSCLYCIILPFVFTRILDAHLLFVHKITGYYWIKGVSLSVGGCFFVFLHFFNMSFKLDIFTDYFIGRFNLIVFLQAAALIFSYLAVEMLITVKKMSTYIETKRVFYKSQSFTKISFVLVLLASAIATTFLTPPLVPKCKRLNSFSSIKVSNSSFRVIVLDINYLHDMYGKDNIGCITDTIQKLQPDLFHLINSNVIYTSFGGKDLIGYLKNINIFPYGGTTKTFTPKLYFGTSESFCYCKKTDEKIFRNRSYLFSEKKFEVNKQNKTLTFITFDKFYKTNTNFDLSFLNSSSIFSENYKDPLILISQHNNAKIEKSTFGNITKIHNLSMFLNSKTNLSNEHISSLNGISFYYRNFNLSQVHFENLVNTKEQVVVADFVF